jgi:cell shape-determining protein MreD
VSFSAGLWFALIAGFTIDSIALPPFGATVILFASLACMMALARILMAERRSYTMSVVWGAGFCVVAWAIVPLARAAAGLLNG